MKVLVLGAGNMGLTYAEGMASSPFLNKRKLMIFDVSPQKTEALSTMSQFDAYDSRALSTFFYYKFTFRLG